MRRKYAISFVFYLMISTFVFAQDQMTTVILVRHAEKSTTPANDPALSSQGVARADLLSRMLENAGVTAIFSTQYERTKKTAEPLGRKIGVPVQTLDASASKLLADTIRAKYPGGTILVVGHSNTLPEIIHALGGPKMEELPETEYDHLFVVTMSRKTGVKLLPLKFFSSNAEQVCQ